MMAVGLFWRLSEADRLVGLMDVDGDDDNDGSEGLHSNRATCI